AVSPDGKLLLTGCWNDEARQGEARLWDTASGKPLCPPLRHKDIVVAVALSPDRPTMGTGSQDNTALLWRVPTGEPLPEGILPHDSAIKAVAFRPDGKKVLTGSEDGSIRVWDVDTGQPDGEPLRHGEPVFAVAFSPDGTKAVTT